MAIRYPFPNEDSAEQKVTKCHVLWEVLGIGYYPVREFLNIGTQLCPLSLGRKL